MARIAQKDTALPGFRAQQWYFFAVATFYLYVRRAARGSPRGQRRGGGGGGEGGGEVRPVRHARAKRARERARPAAASAHGGSGAPCRSGPPASGQLPWRTPTRPYAPRQVHKDQPAGGDGQRPG